MPRHPPCAHKHFTTTKQHTENKDARVHCTVLKQHTDHHQTRTPHKSPTSSSSTRKTTNPSPATPQAQPREATRQRARPVFPGPNSAPHPHDDVPPTRTHSRPPHPHGQEPRPAKTPPTPTHTGRHDRRVMLLRKEVIQPHLPVRLPCYDFVPIASPTFDHSPPQGVGPWASGVTDFRDVTGGVYKARERIHRSVADLRLLATPTSWGRVADPNPN